MSTTPHPVAPEEIMGHLDGELSAARAQSVSTHVESCAPCQELVASLRNTSQSLSNWTIGPVPAPLGNSVMHAAAKTPSHSPSAGSNRPQRTRRWTTNQWIGGLAATATALVLLFFIATPNLHRSRMAANQAAAIGRQRRELAEKSIHMTGPASTDQDGTFTDSLRSTNGFDQLEPGTLGKLQEHGRSIQQLKEQDSSNHGRLESGPMIARTVALSIVAKDFDSSRASLDAIVARHHGYSANLTVNTPQGAARTLQASLRIPAQQLPAALVEIKALGRAEAENQNGEEVTQRHADLVARLKNSRETEQRLQAILTQRTGKISDVLEVEQEIARVRGEIEQMEAEQENLEHRVDFATVDLKLSEEYKAKLDSPAPAISTLLHNAAVNGYRNVADTLLAIILFFAEYAPVLVFWLFVFSIPAWLVWRRWRHAVAVQSTL
jgi:hypothetical protein